VLRILEMEKGGKLVDLAVLVAWLATDPVPLPYKA
jgi:hypothetical protein